MINVDNPIPTTYYSVYGYIEVDKNEVNNQELILVSFVRKLHKMTGRVNVRYK